jgi:WD40 repeat protein
VLWNIQHETQLSILTGHQSRVLTGQFSKDGSKILTGSSDRTAILWEAETGQKLQILKGHIDDVRCVLFNPDETRLITTSDDTQVKLWDREFGSRRYVDRNSITFLAVRAAEFHPDGSTIVICESGEVSVYDLKSNKTLHRLNWAWSACEFVKFSDDGTRFYAQNSCNTKIWNAQTGAEIFTHENDGFLNLGLLSPTNDTILTIEDKTAVLWDIIGTQRLVLTGHSSVINSAVFSPNGQHVLTASDDETAILWNAQTGTIVFTLSEHTHKVKHALFTPDGSRIITVSADMSIKFWDSLSGAAVLTIKEVERTLLTATFSRDGSTLFAGGYGGTATLLTAGPSYKAVAPPPRPKP